MEKLTMDDILSLPVPAAMEKLQREFLVFCQAREIPMFMTMAVQNESGKWEFKRVVYHPDEIELPDDQIAKHIQVALGFDVTDKRNKVIFTDSDLYGKDE